MPRSHRLYLEDILQSANNIRSYAGDLSFEELIRDKMRVDAIVRNFEIIGEAAGKIPEEIREKYPSVEWRKISDFRNVLAHEYFQIDFDIMWDIIENKLPELIRQVRDILEKEQ